MDRKFDQDEGDLDGRQGGALRRSAPADEGGHRLRHQARAERAKVNSAIAERRKTLEANGFAQALRELDAPPAFSRQADGIEAYKMQRATDAKGMPAFANRHILIANAQRDPISRGEGVWSHRWAVYDRTKSGERGGRFLKVGELYADLDPDGNFETLRGITIYRRFRQKGVGYGEDVVASMLASNAPGHRMGVWNIVHSTAHAEDNALPFWKKLGTRLHNLSNDPNVEINGDVSLADYLRARGGESRFRRDAQDQFAPAETAPQPAGGQARPSRDGGAREPGADAGRAGRRQAVLGREQGPARGLTEAAVRRLVDPIVAKWGNAPKVTVVASMQDPRVPESVRARDARERAECAKGEPQGFIQGKQVYIVASAVDSPWSVYKTLFHEVLGHHGLRGTFGDRLDDILEAVARANPAEVAARKGLSRLQAAEEILADMAQTKPHAGLVRRAIAAIRQFLRELGIDLKLSDNDILVNFILPARGFVERSSEEAEQPAGAAPAFAREDSGQSELRDLLEQYENDKMTPRDILAEVQFLLGDGRAPESLRAPADAFAEELVDDYALSGRGDIDTVQDAFMAAVEAAAGDGASFSREAGLLNDSNGKPLTVYRGVKQGVKFQDSRSGMLFFSPKESYARLMAGKDGQVGAFNLRIGNLKKDVDIDAFEFPGAPENAAFWKQLQADGYDGAVDTYDEQYVVFDQSKAIPVDDTASFSRADGAAATPDDFAPRVREELGNLFTSQRTFNRWWHRTVGTQFHKAKQDRDFKRVFDRGQDYLTDTTRYAMMAESEAPNLLLRLEGASDIFKRGISTADKEAIAKPIFLGTLEDTLFDDATLAERFGLNERQVGYYREFRAATDKSLEELAKSTLAKMAHAVGVRLDAVSRDLPFDRYQAELRAVMRDRARALKDIADDYPIGDRGKPLALARAREAVDQMKAMVRLFNQVTKLKANGYAPLMRFGEYTST
jgi:hypothetical protein